MSFDTSVITEIFHTQFGPRLELEWTSSAPAGTFYQIYIQGQLAWWGRELFATVPIPSGLVDVQIGAVGSGEQTLDFADAGLDAFGLDVFGLDGAGLASVPITTRARLAWFGFGATKYRIYQGGAGFDHGGFDLGGLDGTASTLVDTVTVTEQGLDTEGLDVSNFDVGGLDQQGGNFEWTSQPLARGPWNFAVAPVDQVGNEGAKSLTAVTITAPPRPPAPNTKAKRLTNTYNATAHTVTLNWLASPG